MNTPLGKTLVQRVATAKEKARLLRLSLPSLAISDERATEVRNIAHGVYSPLTGFLGKKDVGSVLRHCTLTTGVFWPIPIILDISKEQALQFKKQNVPRLFLTSSTGRKLALLDVSEIYMFDKKAFCMGVFKTTNTNHPGVKKIFARGEYLIAGDITLLQDTKGEFARYNLSPQQVRGIFAKRHWKTIVGFHTRNVPHRGHEHVQREGLKHADGIFVNPLVGVKKAGDFRNEVVLKAYEYLARYVLPRGKSLLGILPHNPYYAGPREALLTAVIRKNFGCTHFIIGRDHTGVGDYYKPQDYERMLARYQGQMGITVLHFKEALYCRGCGGMTLENLCVHDEHERVRPSGTKVRAALVAKKHPPHEMMRPEIVQLVLRQKTLFV